MDVMSLNCCIKYSTAFWWEILHRTTNALRLHVWSPSYKSEGTVVRIPLGEMSEWGLVHPGWDVPNGDKSNISQTQHSCEHTNDDVPIGQICCSWILQDRPDKEGAEAPGVQVPGVCRGTEGSFHRHTRLDVEGHSELRCWVSVQQMQDTHQTRIISCFNFPSGLVLGHISQ